MALFEGKFGERATRVARHNVHMGPLVRNAAAGVLATGMMSVVMAAAKATGLMHNPPPKHITHRAEKEAGLKPRRQSDDTFRVTWLAAHFAYGMGSGVVYGLVRGALPGSAWVSGLLYGGSLWGVSYLGIMPALGLYPFPNDDSSSRVAVMIVAHAVYGESLSQLADRSAS